MKVTCWKMPCPSWETAPSSSQGMASGFGVVAVGGVPREAGADVGADVVGGEGARGVVLAEEFDDRAGPTTGAGGEGAVEVPDEGGVHGERL